MRTIAVYNLKGGVGKTATAVNLSWLAATAGFNTLAWDLDPQGAATWYFGGKSRRKTQKPTGFGNKPLKKLVRSSPWERLDYIPAAFANRHLDRVIESDKKPRSVVTRLCDSFEGDYSLMFLDCPPSLSTLAESIFEAADLILIPVVPSHLSVRAAEQAIQQILDTGVKKKKIAVFFSMADKRRKLHREILEQPPKDFPHLLSSVIPNASIIERMGDTRAPVQIYAPNSEAAAAYRYLWVEVSARMPKIWREQAQLQLSK